MDVFVITALRGERKGQIFYCPVDESDALARAVQNLESCVVDTVSMTEETYQDVTATLESASVLVSTKDSVCGAKDFETAIEEAGEDCFEAAAEETDIPKE